MKSIQTNHWKLGLFVTLSFFALAGTMWWLGLRRFDKESFKLVTFFDESVQGLEVGAPVKMRGVKVGNVRDISFAEDGQTVQVDADLYVSTLLSLGLGNLRGLDPDSGRFEYGDLRARIGMQGITGVCYLAVEKLPGSALPELPFSPPSNYLPAASSTLSLLEESAVGIADKLPEIIANVDALVRKLNGALEQVDFGALSGRAVSLLETTDAKVGAVDVESLQREASEALTAVRDLADRASGVLAQLEGDPPPVERLVASVEELAESLEGELTAAELPATTAAFRRLVRDSDAVTGELLRDLVALGRVLDALRGLAEYLERNPSALLRGRAGN